jgi:hypothetical protein
VFDAGDAFAPAAWVFAWACAPDGTALARATLLDVVTAYDDGPSDEPVCESGAARRTIWWADATTRRAFMAGMVWAWWPLAVRLEDVTAGDAGGGVFTWDALPPGELRHVCEGWEPGISAAAMLKADASGRAGAFAGASLADVCAAECNPYEAWAALAAVLPTRDALQDAVYGRAA